MMDWMAENGDLQLTRPEAWQRRLITWKRIEIDFQMFIYVCQREKGRLWLWAKASGFLLCPPTLGQFFAFWPQTPNSRAAFAPAWSLAGTRPRTTAVPRGMRSTFCEVVLDCHHFSGKWYALLAGVGIHRARKRGHGSRVRGSLEVDTHGDSTATA